MSYFYIYKMIHPETGEFYIGSRKSKVEPNNDINYRGSSATWYRQLSKDIIQNVLIKEILDSSISSKEDLNEAEIKWISENIKNPLCKNAHIPGLGFYILGSFSDEHKKNISLSKTGKKNPMHGREFSKEHREKLSKSRIGKKHSEETKEKLKASSKHKAPWNKGKILSEEIKKKMSESSNCWCKGKKLSEETKRKMSESAKNRKNKKT
jgi:hypothetical protein